MSLASISYLHEQTVVYYTTRGKYSNRPAWACILKSDYMIHILNKMWSFCPLKALTNCTSAFQLQRMQSNTIKLFDEVYLSLTRVPWVQPLDS